jgi:D-tyrosyl-tRNA(Tyr) deacylase
MADGEGKMNLSVKDVNAEILIVSQFTLYGDTSGGNRPSFIKAARPEVAEPLYDYFVEKVKSLGISVGTGKFGAEMKIEAELDGPVTILIEQGK